MQWCWKVKTPKMQIQDLYQIYISNLNFVAQFIREIGWEQTFYKVKNKKNPHISSSNWSKRKGVGHVMQHWIFYQLAEKGTIFPIQPFSTLSLKFGNNWFLSWRYPYFRIPNTSSIQAYIPNLINFGLYQAE